MVDGSPIDSSLFTLDDPTNPYSLSVQTDDATKKGDYNLRVSVALQDYPDNPGHSKDFLVRVEDQCKDSNFAVVPAPPPDETYLVARPAQVTQAFDDFEPQFPFCPFSMSATIAPALVAPDDTAIVFDDVGKTFTVETQNLALAGEYVVTVRYVFADGTVSNDLFFDFKIIIEDPCIAALLDVPASVFPDPYEYVLG